jgi:archaellum component FlaF (FlaF/FlaG flagellin family)
MGFGTVVAGIYFVAILLVSCYVYADLVTRTSSISFRSIESASSIQMEKLRSSANIGSILLASDHTKVYANITNTGEIKIVNASLQYIDILITYTDNRTGVTQSYWCYYDPHNSTIRDRWFLNWTIHPNPFPAIINPLDWDPSKTLSITIELGASHQIRARTDGHLKLILPLGSSSEQKFTG